MSLVKYGKMAVDKYPAVRKRYKVYAPAVRQLASDVMYLKGLVNAEPHNHYVNSSNNFSYSGTIISCCDVPQDDTDAGRTGNRILPRWFSINGMVQMRPVASAVNHHVTVRVIIFRWWGEIPNAVGTAPLVTDILRGTTIGTQYAPFSHLNTAITGSKGDRDRRIEVLRNFQITLDPVSITSKDFCYNIQMNGKSKAKKEHVDFYDNTLNPPTSGGIFVLFVGDQSLAGVLDVNYRFESKLTFYDN